MNFTWLETTHIRSAAKDCGPMIDNSHPPRRRLPTLSTWAAASILSRWVVRASATSAGSRAASCTRWASGAFTASRESSCTASTGSSTYAPAVAHPTSRGARAAVSWRFLAKIRGWIGRMQTADCFLLRARIGQINGYCVCGRVAAATSIMCRTCCRARR